MTQETHQEGIKSSFAAIRALALMLLAMGASVALFVGVYFSLLSQQWILFLVATLVVIVLSETARLSHAEWIALRRAAKLSVIKRKLEHETHLRKQIETVLADGKTRLNLLDEVLATMVLLVDNNGECRYHNRAFAAWIRLRPGQIVGKHMREILGAKFYQDIAFANRKSLDGHHVRYEYTHSLSDSRLYKLTIQHVPLVGSDGKVQGFYMLLDDITETTDANKAQQAIRMISTIPPGASAQSLFVDSFAEQVIGDKEAANRIMSAIEKGEFRLFCQLIRPLAIQDGAIHHEILVRLLEEEESMMPPGAFFPLAERFGLMVHLDRWVVRHVVKLIAAEHAQGLLGNGELFFINISEDTLLNTAFPEFLHCVLLEYQVHGHALCFEITDTDLAAHHAAVVTFVQQVQPLGVKIALSGFGGVRVRFDPMEDFWVDFLKIDGSIVLDILRDPLALAKITAIQHVAKEFSIKTIAEFVESEDIISKLTELGIDFAQGFGISRPAPLLMAGIELGEDDAA